MKFLSAIRKQTTHRGPAPLLKFFLLLGVWPSVALHGQASSNLVLEGGHVIDPRNRIDAVRNVAIKDQKIAAGGRACQAGPGTKVVDVTGLYVTPGLLDIHVHVYAGTGERHSYVGSTVCPPTDLPCAAE